MVFQQKLLEKASFIFKLTGRAKVRPASSDKWKALKEKTTWRWRAQIWPIDQWQSGKLSTGGRAQSFPLALAS